MRKKLFRCVGGIMVMVMLLATAPPTMALTELEKAENDVEEAKKEQERLEAQLKDTEAALDSLEALKGNTEAYIKEMDIYIENLAANIYKLEQQAVDKQAEIDEKKQEIAEIEQDIDEQYEAMKLRIQFMYENGEDSYFALFLESYDISDFLNRAEYLTQITDYDREMLERLEDTQQALIYAKEELDTELAELNKMLAEVEAEKEAAMVLVEAKMAELWTTTSDIASKEQAIKEQQQAIKEQEALVKELEAIEEKRRQEAEKNMNLTYDGGRLTWPIPGYTRLSSYFGYRSDPFTGIQKYHSGIDMPAPIGTPIVAAYDGQVAWSYYSSSAGNWIGIDHGNGLYTIYMHMSKLIATNGQYVKKGEVIGLCGSTGRSTGAHLHFSVRLNGAYVDPLSYVSP